MLSNANNFKGLLFAAPHWTWSNAKDVREPNCH